MFVTGVVVGVVAGPGMVRAEVPVGGDFSVIARADGASVEVVDPTAPVVSDGQVAAVTPSSSQAVTDSLGSSQAFASAPYPGELVVSVPGTANGAAGTPLPAYPLYVSSSFPTTRTASVDQPGYRLDVKSDAQRSSAYAAAGGAGDPAVASMVTAAEASRAADGSVVARAQAEIEGLRVTNILTIGRLSTEATAKRSPGGDLERSTKFTVGQIIVAGVGVTVSDKDVKALETTVPLPGLEGVAPILGSAGITVEYAPATETPDGVSSASLIVRHKADVPGHGPVTLTYHLGRASASATATVDDGASDDVVSGGGFAAAPSPSAKEDGTSHLAGAIGSDDGAASTDTGSPSPATGRRSPSPIGVAAIAAVPLPSGLSFYLVLVGAALTVFALSELLTVFGLRSGRSPTAMLIRRSS